MQHSFFISGLSIALLAGQTSINLVKGDGVYQCTVTDKHGEQKLIVPLAIDNNGEIFRQSNLSTGTFFWSDIYVIGSPQDKTRENLSFRRSKSSLFDTHPSVKIDYFESENEKKKNDDNVLLMWRIYQRERNCTLWQRFFLYLIWRIWIYDWIQASANVTHRHENIHWLKIVQNTVDEINR